MNTQHQIKAIGELHADYIAHTAVTDEVCYEWGRILPTTFGLNLRPVLPGETVMLMGETGSGKTALLQAIGTGAKKQPLFPFALETLFCEMELPGVLCYERFAAMHTGVSCRDVELDYKRSMTREDNVRLAPYHAGLEHLKVCDSSRINEEILEELIMEVYPKKFGCKPVVVCVDYIGLMNSKGNRYERAAQAAQELKRIAKATNTIMFFVAQIHRTGEDEASHIGLHSARGAGELEESSGVIVGVMRDEEDKGLMRLKILKSTKDGSGAEAFCDFKGESMQITERTMKLGTTEDWIPPDDDDDDDDITGPGF